MAAVLQVDYRPDLCSSGFDEDFPFLLQGRVDPDRYAATICAANSRVRNANSRLLMGVLLMIIIIVPAFVIFPISVVSWGFTGFYVAAGAMALAFILMIVAIIGAQRARHSVECFLHDENTNYYNALGVNLKLHRHYRHTWIAIEVLPAHPQQQQQQIYVQQQQPQYGGDYIVEQQYAPIKGATTSEASPLVYAVPQQQQQGQQGQPQFSAPVYAYGQQPPPQNPYPQYNYN